MVTIYHNNNLVACNIAFRKMVVPWIHAYILIVGSKCEAVWSISCMYLSILIRNNKFSYPPSCSTNNADLARYLSSDLGVHAWTLTNILMHFH